MDVQGAIWCNDGGGQPFVEGGQRKHSSREGGEVVHRERKPFVKGGCRSSREGGCCSLSEGGDWLSRGKRPFIGGEESVCRGKEETVRQGKEPVCPERHLSSEGGGRLSRKETVCQAREETIH